MNYLDEQSTIDKVELELIPIMFEQKARRSDVFLHHPQYRRHIDAMTDTVCHQFRAYVLGETQKPITFDSHPVSWWQMFKRDVMPRWFVKRFPVVSKTATIDAKVFYPELKISVPQKESRVCVVFQARVNPFIPHHSQ